MKCCHYERHLKHISGTFTVTSSFCLKLSSFLFSFLYIEEEPHPPRSIPGDHTGLPPHVGQCLPLSAFWAMHLHISHSYLVTRSMMVGHIPTVHTCSFMGTNHKDMTAHVPAFFTELDTTHIYVEYSTAGHSLISHLWSNASSTVTHPCINQAHDCLTSVIRHKTFAPCYVSPQAQQ